MPDITRLIMRDHARLREMFADLDDAQVARDVAAIEAVWRPLGDLLDLHAEAEEQVFYPVLLDRGVHARAETEDAIEDHNKIRDAVRAANAADVGTDAWWSAVGDARTENSKHIAEEEREALSDFRRNVEPAEREQLGLQWLVFVASATPPIRLAVTDKDPDEYIEEESG
jgi:hypothetical protein